MINPAYLPPQWMQSALCAQIDTEIFYPDRGDSASADMARKICRMCDVKKQCLQYAVDNNERHGIWGGTIERERRPMLKIKNIAC
jgi:hypothetical protein